MLDFTPVTNAINDLSASERKLEGLIQADDAAQAALVNATETANGTAEAKTGGINDTYTKAQTVETVVEAYRQALLGKGPWPPAAPAPEPPAPNTPSANPAA